MNISGTKRKAKPKANPSSQPHQPTAATDPSQSTLIHTPQISSAQQRAETMAAINAALVQATDEASILAAVAEYADAQGAAGVLLNYATPGENISSADFTPVARWIFKHPFPYRVIDEGSEKFHDVIIEIRDLALQEPGSIFYVENVETDERIKAESRADFLPQYPMRAEAMLGLYSGGRWQGSLIIMWHQPHVFSDEERYVYEQIVQNLSAVVATRRAYLAEQEAREEATTLYKVSEAVNSAKTYDELLRAVAVLEPQADNIYLFIWENFDFNNATYMEVAAIHNMQSESPIKPGTHLQKSQFPYSTRSFSGRFWFVEDIHADPTIDPISRASWDALNTRAVLMMRLIYGETRIGSVAFHSSEPRAFSERKRRLALAIGDLVTAAVERIRLAQNMQAAVEAQAQAYVDEQSAREEATTLYKVSEAVNSAKTYDELLRAVAVLEPQADTLYLYLWENYDFVSATDYEVTAIYDMQGKSPLKPGHRLLKRDFPFSGKKFPERYWFIEDTHSDPEVDPISRASWDAMNSRAILMVRLVYGEKRIGSVAFHSAEPRAFSERKRRLALAIGDLVTAAVERIRLAQSMQAAVEAQAQAYVDEQSAREEMSLLYQAAEAINTAATFAEVIKAIAPLARGIERVYLFLWQHLDYRKANHFDLVAGINQEGEMPVVIGTRFTEDQFPIAQHVVKARQVAIEDIHNHPLVDPLTRDSWEAANARALLLVALVQNQRWYGTLSFESSTPRQYSERDRRLTLAISDLVASAIIRIQAQQETAAAHAESAFLYQLAGEINAALTYQEIVDAVARLQAESSGIFMSFFEHLDMNLASYSETIAFSAVSDQLKQHIKPETPVIKGTFNNLQNDRIWVSEDFFADPRFDDAGRDYYRDLPVRAGIVIPLRAGERIWGMLTFYYPQPHVFGEQERRIATGIGDLVGAAVERIRLQRETVVAKEEADFLYQLAEQINAATSYQAILDAVVRLMPDSEGVFLNLCENFDFDNASYFEVPVGANVPKRYQWMIGTRIPKASFPFANDVRDQRLVVVDNIQTDPRIDDVSRESWKVIGTGAFMAVLFHREERLFGWLLFVRSEPHVFVEHDRRLAMGIGDLAKAAIERIHLQQETIAAKEESHFLYQLAEQINAATSYQAILDAVVRLLPDCEGVYLNLYENFDIDRANYFEIPVAANIPEELQYIVGMRVPKDRFPMAEQLRDQRLLVIEDTDTDLRADEVSRANWKVTGTRAVVIVTFHREGRLFGWLFFNKSQPYHFPERDLRLILGIGDLAKAAVERIYLQQETITARQHAETLANLNASFSRAVNELDLLRAFVPFAASIGAYRVEMAYADYIQADPFASYLIALWMDGEYTDYRQPGHQIRHVSRKDYLLGPLFLPHPDQVMYSPDIGNDSRLDPERRAWMKTHLTMGAAVILPFMHAGEFQGLISINWKEPHTFSDDERFILERLLQTLPAVIATRRVYIAEQEARAENELLYTVGKEINRSKTNHEVMEAVNRSFPDPLYVAIFMWENYDRNKATYTETVISTDPGLPAGTRLPRDVFDLSSTVSGKVQIIHDVNAPEWADDAAAASARRFGIMSVAFTSLVENQRVVGVFAVGCKTQRNFTDREIRLMSGVTELTGAALERFRLRDETERARQRAHDLAALEERTRLARELHDSVSQALYGIGLGAQTAYRSLDKNPTIVRESVEYVLTLAEAGLAEMRALIFELRPESLETEGLAVALAKQAASIQARHAIEVQIELGDEPQMVLATKESLYRVAREALHNVVKHANATRIMLRMQSDNRTLRLDVIDNGIGFETSKDFPGHLGLHSMRERVIQMGGEISIKSAPGDGTQLSVMLPL